MWYSNTLRGLGSADFFTNYSLLINQPLPLAGIKNNTRDYWGVGVCGGCADDREIATACDQASQ